MKLINSKHSVIEEFEKLYSKNNEFEEYIKFKISKSISNEILNYVPIEKYSKFQNFENTSIYETNFYIASKKEFDELTKLLVEISPYISNKAYQRFKNILFNYEK